MMNRGSPVPFIDMTNNLVIAAGLIRRWMPAIAVVLVVLVVV